MSVPYAIEALEKMIKDMGPSRRELAQELTEIVDALYNLDHDAEIEDEINIELDSLQPDLCPESFAEWLGIDVSEAESMIEAAIAKRYR